MEDNRTSKVSSASSGTDARSSKATEEAAGDTVPDEEGEDGGERKVFLFFIFCRCIALSTAVTLGTEESGQYGKVGDAILQLYFLRGNNVVFKKLLIQH